MGKEILNFITCPHCGNTEATVHLQMSSAAKLYYRCYTEIGGTVARCGTVQIPGTYGQRWINENKRPYLPKTLKGQPAANEPKGSPPPVPAVALSEPQPAPAPKGPANDPKEQPTQKGGGVLDAFARFWSEDDDE